MGSERTPGVVTVLVTFNGLDDTIACVESLLRTTYARQQIVVVDNGTSGEAEALEARFGHAVATIRAGRNLGFRGRREPGHPLGARPRCRLRMGAQQRHDRPAGDDRPPGGGARGRSGDRDRQPADNRARGPRGPRRDLVRRRRRRSAAVAKPDTWSRPLPPGTRRGAVGIPHRLRPDDPRRRPPAGRPLLGAALPVLGRHRPGPEGSAVRVDDVRRGRRLDPPCHPRIDGRRSRGLLPLP